MRPEEIREHVATQPFERFRIFMSDGETFDVTHPDLCLIGRSAVKVVIPDAKKPWMYDRLAHCSLIHITRIEPLNGDNGRGKSRGARRRR